MIIHLPRQLLRPEAFLQRRRRLLNNEARLAYYLAFLFLVSLAAYVYLLPASRTATVQAQIRQVSSNYETQLTANAEMVIAISQYTNMAALTARAQQKGFELPTSAVFVPVPDLSGGPLASGASLNGQAPAAAQLEIEPAHAATR